MEKFKTANALYRASGSTLPFKHWITEQKEKGQFFFNKPLNTKIMENAIGQHSFHSADGVKTTVASKIKTAAANTSFSKRDAKLIIVGAGTAVALFFIAKSIFHAH